MRILGISCYYHDAAACLIKDGKIVAATEEERFTRVKHDISFPINAINYCLEEAGIKGKDIRQYILNQFNYHKSVHASVSDLKNDRKDPYMKDPHKKDPQNYCQFRKD